MNQDYIKICGMLETGIDLVSPHVRWLLRQAITDYCPTEAINLIAYNKDIPTNHEGKPVWGEVHSPSKSICFNLERHFNHAVDNVQKEKSMFTSLRCILIRELLDTSIHEAHHLKMSLEENNFNNSDLDEDGAQAVGWKYAWMAAKHWDVNIVTFGPFLDKLVEDFMLGVEADTLETPVMWKDLQVYMWKNELAFYNPDKDQECRMFEAFQSMAEDENPWLEQPKTYVEETTISETTHNNDEEPIAEVVHELPPATLTPVAGVNKPEALTNPAPIMAAQPKTTEPVTTPVAEPLPPATGIIAGTLPPTQPQIQNIATLPEPQYGDINAAEIQRCAETVIRTLFWHIKNKCEFNASGTYNNPKAVLDPINISHIPHAEQLFTHMDTMTELGTYTSNQPCQGMVKGLVDADNMPYYRFYLNFGGKLHIRSLVPHNPIGKTTKWAEEARSGIMRLSFQERIPKIDKNTGKVMINEQGKKLGENKIRADIKLAAGSNLGQEEFNLWSK